MTRHTRLDEKRLEFHRAIARRLVQDPGLIEIALANLNRWEARRGSQPYWEEWRRILTTCSAEEVATLVVEDSERSRSLRQSTPFTGILSPEERDRIFE